MRGVILILAASAAFSLPAPAEAGAERGGAGVSHHRSPGQFAASGVRVHRGHHGGRHDRGDDDRRGFPRFADGSSDDRRFRGDTYFPYRDYQGDTLWRPEGFNDWWHDRPDRAFPRWVSGNARCERMWWSGGGWRC